MGPLAILGARGSELLAELTPPASLTEHIPDALRGRPGENLAGIYAAVREAIAGRGRVLADFGDALASTLLVEAIQKSAAGGRRVTVQGQS